VSLAVPAPARYVLWAAAVVVDAAGPVVATWRGDTAPLHMEHLPERFGLFVILVLGEVVAGIVTGVHDAAWAGLSVTVAAVGFVVGGALWWTYFDVASASGNEELQEDEEKTEDEADGRHDLYVYGHLPLSLGIAAAGVGIEELVMHPYADLPAPAGWTATGGITLIGAGIVLVGAHKPLSAMWPWPVVAIAPLLVFTVLDVPVLVLVGLLALTTAAVAVSGARQRARRGVALA
jgi:low temperature requirement protein LtrA